MSAFLGKDLIESFDIVVIHNSADYLNSEIIHDLEETKEIRKGKTEQSEIILCAKDEYGNKCSFIDFRKEVSAYLESTKIKRQNLVIDKNPDKGEYGSIKLDFKTPGIYQLSILVN